MLISKNLQTQVNLRSQPATEKAKLEEQSVVDSFREGQPAWGQSLTGDIRYHDFHSKVLNNDRQVWVYLPPSYREHPEKKYPVLYACDGQNVFERGTAFGGNEWQVDEAAQRLMENGKMEETIIVAVSNAGAGRMNEYTHVADKDYGGGKADQYAKFMIDELKPAIDGAYRTEKGPETTGVMGSSLGGLVSLYLSFNHPNVFGVCGAMSPSIWWANKDIISHIAAKPAAQNPGRVWVDMGTQESKTDEDKNGVDDVLDHTRELKGLLEKRGFSESGAAGKPVLGYWEVPGAGHNEPSWANRMDDVLPELFPKK